MEETVCYCKNVSKKTILEAIKSGARSVSDIQKMTKACTDNRCKERNPKKICCYDDIVTILKENTEYKNEHGSCCCSKRECC